jgi:hypothetical protein
MTLKVTNSSQEWCGQTYMQVNYNEKKRSYDYLLHSYFENEGDKEGQVKAAMMEEDPSRLPTRTLGESGARKRWAR